MKKKIEIKLYITIKYDNIHIRQADNRTFTSIG